MGELLLMNPVKKRGRKRTVAKSPVKRRRSPVAKIKRRRVKRNPIKVASLQKDVMAGATGAMGAIASEIAVSKMTFLPETMQAGPAKQVVKALIGVGLGMIADKAKMRALGKNVALGTITVAAHDLLKEYMPPGLMGEFVYDYGMSGIERRAPVLAPVIPSVMPSASTDQSKLQAYYSY